MKHGNPTCVCVCVRERESERVCVCIMQKERAYKTIYDIGFTR